MPLDSNGIWQYEETESAAPVAAMLNRLAGSVSDVVAPLIGDTGWEVLPLVSGFSGSLLARRIGSRVNVRGTVAPDTNWGAANTNVEIVNAMPEQYRSVAAFVTIGATTAGTTATFFRIALSGALINVRPSTASHTGGVYINLDYLAD